MAANESVGSARWYFVASLLIGITFGATVGALMLATKTLPVDLLGGRSLESIRLAHGYAQVFGFAALFVMGVALHVVPRIKGVPLAAAGLVRIAFWLQLAGVLACIWGAFDGLAWPRLAGGAALVGGAACFAVIINRTLAGGVPTAQHLEPYLRAGCLWLIAAAVLALAGALPGAGELQLASWEAAVWGFAASWLFGMSLRIVPGHLGLNSMRPIDARRLLVAYQAAATLWVLIAIGETWAPLPGSRFLAGLVLTTAGLAFVLRLGMLGRQPGAPPAEPAFQGFVVSAYAWLAVALCLGPGASSLALVLGVEPPPLLADFARHAFVLGFLTQMVMGVSLRVIPLFAGARLWSERLRAALVVLLNAAVAVRGLQVLVVLGADSVWPWVALSGAIALAAFLVFGVNLVMSLRRRAAIAVAG